jgi:hypothetical protein
MNRNRAVLLVAGNELLLTGNPLAGDRRNKGQEFVLPEVFRDSQN